MAMRPMERTLLNALNSMRLMRACRVISVMCSPIRRGSMVRIPETAALRLSTIGSLMVIAFVVIRAASFHHVDQVINFRLGGVRMNWVLELGAIAVVAAGAWKKGRRESTPENAEGWVPTR